MKIQTTGTIIDGLVKLDGHIALPNHSRVNVSLETAEQGEEASAAAMTRFIERAKQRAFNSGGVCYTRDELHERD